VTDDLLDLIGSLSPIAEELGSLDELHLVQTIIDHGPSYLRQLRVAEASFGSLKAVVGALAAELRDDTLTTRR